MSEKDEKARARLVMLEGVIAKGSTDPFVHYARAMELRSLDQKEEALTALGEVAERFADYVPTYLMAAQVCEQLGRFDEGIRWCERGELKAKDAGDDHALSELRAFRDELA